MRLYNILFILVVAINLSNCTTKEKPFNKNALMETIDRFNTAFREGNIEVLESMVASDYTHTNGTSKAIRKKDWFNYLKKRKQDIESGALRILNYEMDEIDIKYYNTTAIVTGRILVSSSYQNKATENAYRVTHIWVYESGSWKRAGFHDGKIK